MSLPSAIRRLGLLGATLALALASCSVSKSDTATDGPASTTAAAGDVDHAAAFADVPVRGVTDDTITLGVAMIDFAKVAEQFGVDIGGGGNAVPDGVVDALVEGINADGGINGRTLEVVEVRFIPIGTESPEASCRELIEDHEVFAVIGAYLGDDGLCVTETHSTPYFSGWGLSEERQERSNAPFITVEDSLEDAAELQMQAAVDAGIFDDKKVAVYWEAETPDAVIDNRVLPILADGGVDVVAKAKLPESGDQVKAGQDIDNIFEKFRSEGADTLVVWSGLGVPIPALQRAAWKPQVVFTNGQANDSLEGFGLQDPEVLEGDLAVMSAVPVSVLENDPEFLACLDTINEYTDLDLQPSDVQPTDIDPDSVGATQVPQVCQMFSLAAQVLRAAGDDPSASSIIDGLADLDHIVLPGIPDGSLGPTKWGAGRTPYIWEWDVDGERFIREDEPGAS